MKQNLLIIIFLISLSYISPAIPIWDYHGSIIDLFTTDNPNSDEKEVFNNNDYHLTRTISKSGDSISINYKLIRTGLSMDVDFEEIGGVFYDVTDLSTVICPRGNFHPLKSNGESFTINDFQNPNPENKKWDLKCIKHTTSGYFLAFYFNKGKRSLYGYSSDRKKWDGSKEFHDELYDIKIKDYSVSGNSEYPIVFLTKDGDWLKLVGAKLTLKNFNGENIDRANCETRSLDFQLKEHTTAYFNDNNDIFYLLTYNSDSYSFCYSTTATINNYQENNDIKNVAVTKKQNQKFEFIDNVEILEMKFIGKTQNVYYSIKNTVTGEIYHGVMDLINQKILFNINQAVVKFEPYSDYEMLVIKSDSANKICLYKSGSSCVASCPSGTSLVLNVNGNECKSSTTCQNYTLMPDNICIDVCNTNIYKLDDTNKICALCNYFGSSSPYRIMNTDECLENKPNNTDFYNEKLYLLVCSNGYQLDTESNQCVPHCYTTCETCSDFSEDSTNQKCLTCKTGYNLNGETCEEIIPEKPSTIITENKASTIITEKIEEETNPSTIITEKKLLQLLQKK